MPDLHQFHAWDQPETAVLSTPEVVKLYERGFSGVGLDAAKRQALTEELRAESQFAFGGQVCAAMGYEDSAAGQLVAPFVHVLERYPKAWPGPGQQRGDCVSHGQKNANLGTMVLESVAGLPDEVTGHVEECPDVSPEGERNGVLSTEALYWHRESGGDGWYCQASAKVSKTEAGAVLRKDYPEAGIDLTAYSGKLAGQYGRRAPTGAVSDALDDNLFRDATEIDSFESLRDLLARGFFVNTCGSEGFSDQRDANGWSKRRGSWAHSMLDAAVDDRPWAHQTYGGPGVLVGNSWGPRWNSGPRDIHDSAQYVPVAKRADWIAKGIVNAATGNIMIPEGFFWARWADVKRRYRVAMGGLNGWRRELLPDFRGGWT